MSDSSFEVRKQDHIRLALDPSTEANGGSGLDQIELIHEALPEINFSEIQTTTRILDREVRVPFFVSSMTAGHGQGEAINSLIARACQSRGWLMGVGSQRRELSDLSVREEWTRVRKLAPDVLFMGNIGLTQVITSPISDIQKMVDSLGAFAMIVHTNPLQEALQPEGTPQFKGGLQALEKLAKGLSVPVILKETGCGFSRATLHRLRQTGIAAVDISGYGGTHWGRIEGQRSVQGTIKNKASETFKNWGISTVESLKAAIEFVPDYDVWASGGVRTGLDGARLLAMGAQAIGLAKPILQAALDGQLESAMEKIEFELKVAMFCTGHATVKSLRESSAWRVAGRGDA